MAGAFGVLFANIATSTSTQVSANAGTFFGLAVNTGQAGASVTVYDGTSTAGTLIGIYTATAQGAIAVPGNGCVVRVGLFVVTAGATPANVTIFYH